MNYLVVDGEPAICDGTIRRLRKIIRPGDRIWAAYSGEEALEILAAESIAVLITDIQMDALSGLGLIERAEKLQPIPMACIVITAHEIFEYARRAMELGVRDYLLKPYSESELTAAVSKAVATLENQWLLGRMKLEKALLAQEPSEIAPEWFEKAGMSRPPAVVQAVRLSPPLPRDTVLPFRWSYLTLGGELMLFSDEHTVFEQWCAGQNVWIGASLPGPLTAERLRQAGCALQIARLDGQSRTAFYSEAMTNDQMLKQNNPVLWAVSYVQSNPGRPVHLRELCAQMHLNYSYFSRQFHQQTGKTFTDYVQGVQMQWASGELRKGRKSGEIAEQLGYLNQDGFAKSFVRVFGCSPRKWLATQESAEKSKE